MSGFIGCKMVDGTEDRSERAKKGQFGPTVVGGVCGMFWPMMSPRCSLETPATSRTLPWALVERVLPVARRAVSSGVKVGVLEFALGHATDTLAKLLRSG